MTTTLVILPYFTAYVTMILQIIKRTSSLQCGGDGVFFCNVIFVHVHAERDLKDMSSKSSVGYTFNLPINDDHLRERGLFNV